jgi:uncharacterized protein (DUF305 family)
VTEDGDVVERPRKPVWLYSTLGLSLMLVIGLVLGFAGGLLAPSKAPDDDSAEAGFTRDMSAHHAQAVQMGMMAAQKGNLEEVRYMGVDISLTQQGQIGIMGQMLRDWNLNVNGANPPMAWMPDGPAALQNGRMPGMASPEEIAQLEKATGEDFDKLFLELMIRHHLGGVHMIESALEQSDDADVQWIAKAMKISQASEVTGLQQILTKIESS